MQLKKKKNNKTIKKLESEIKTLNYELKQNEKTTSNDNSQKDEVKKK